jgi:hypothetical protein
MEVTRIVLESVLALLLLSTGGGKLAGASSSHSIRDSLSVSPARWKAIGAVELVVVCALVVGIWLPAVGVVACAAVAILMLGALATRLRAGEKVTSGTGLDVVVLVVAVVALILGADAA